MTLPDAAAWIGVPYGTPMSIPVCIRPQRMPKGLVTGPLTGQMKPLAEGVESDAGGLSDAGCDPLVLSPDLVHVVEAVQEIRDARRPDDHVDRVDVALLVHLDQTRVQPSEREPVLATEVDVAARLDPEERRQPVELATVQSKIVFERRKARRDVAHPPFEAVDSRADAVDLG